MALMVRLALVREKSLPSFTDKQPLIREVSGMASTSTTTEQIPVRVFGGPTALFEYGGLRVLTDPTFDPPGEYPVPGGQLTKLGHAAAAPGDLGRIDLVLLSHDEHPDNLDVSGRALLGDVPLVLTTP